VAKFEIKKRTLNIVSILQQTLLLKSHVTVPLHCEIIALHNNPKTGAYMRIVQSVDPNVKWRAWLEENVGNQGWEWDWKYPNNDTEATITIMFRRATDATVFAITHG
jgi:hypothetical protein